MVCQFSTRGRICGGRRTFCTRYRRTRRRGRGEGGRQKAEGIHHRVTEGTEAVREEGGTRQAEEDEAGTFGVNRSLTLGKSKIAQRFRSQAHTEREIMKICVSNSLFVIVPARSTGSDCLNH